MAALSSGDDTNDAIAFRPCILWFTGLSAAGKTSCADEVSSRLERLGCSVFQLDGDVVRQQQSRDLGFSDDDRRENILRVGSMARERLQKREEVVLVALISPFRSARDLVRRSVAPGQFVEIFVDAPLAVCEQRDPKGLYRRARAGEIKHFTGIDSRFEPPQQPELVLNSAVHAVGTLADQVMGYLKSNGYIRHTE